jgi:hypothetical protein
MESYTSPEKNSEKNKLRIKRRRRRRQQRLHNNDLHHATKKTLILRRGFKSRANRVERRKVNPQVRRGVTMKFRLPPTVARKGLPRWYTRILEAKENERAKRSAA